MRTLAVGLALAAVPWLGAAANASPVAGTAGPYPVTMEQDPALPDHTVYRPVRPERVKRKLPVVAFGNGGCGNVGNAYQTLLAEVASHGYLVTAPGSIVPGFDIARPRAAGAPRPAQSKPGQMLAALDWAGREAARRGGRYHGRLDLTRVAVMGQSCGGLEAIAAGKDPRVTTVVVLNSGIIRGGIPNPDGSTRQPAGYVPAGEADLPLLHTPIAYFVGGPNDQAWRGAEADFAAIAHLPVLNANYDVGHGGTWREPHGGAMGAAAIAWLDWRLKGDRAAARWFVGRDCRLCRDSRWKVKKKGVE